MPVRRLTNIPIEIAKTEYLELLISNGMTPRAETIPVAQAAGRVTAAPVYARVCAPRYNASAMDGVALDSKLTLGASATAPVTLTARQYARVDTGDTLPEGCDAVIMLEDVLDNDGSSVTINAAAAPWQHIRQIGEDICAGEMLLPSYSPITPAALGAMIVGGITELPVIKRPAAGYIPIGDELVPPTSELKAGDVTESNSAMYAAMLREWGAKAVTYPIVRDDKAQIRQALETALSECDIVILGAGARAGRDDNFRAVIAELGEVLYQGLAIKPGKPAILGYSGAKPILGVPGYPVSGMIAIEQIIRPIVEYMCRIPPVSERRADATLSKSIVSTADYREYVRVRMGYVKEHLIASPLGRGSGIVTSFMKADGIVEVPQGVAGFDSGEKVRVRMLRPEDELRRALVAIGSHDPLLDELSELLRHEDGDISMVSAHAGSMGGLVAVRRGEAHLAGTHLLDEETGEYNLSFIRKYFPSGGVRLVECVGRTQGLILQKDNPKNISGISGIAQGGLRYVNRQKGSGTRILLDYLCRKNNIGAADIYGYRHEEYTHTSVAALIAAGAADAGLGIYSAAKLFDLDFVPICMEQYDLLIPDYAWELPMLQKLLTALKSEAFRRRLDALGGYTLTNPGVVRLVLQQPAGIKTPF